MLDWSKHAVPTADGWVFAKPMTSRPYHPDDDERVWQRAHGSQARGKRGCRQQVVEEGIAHAKRRPKEPNPAEQMLLLLHRVIPGWRFR